eukprot:CAMPEP_0175076794 /NCGR_PEP_ID=MMETSP0052_2-20121109/22966_1 /TAXON_ID=51329 ORGANISM="Polytomella parva, Strain SAG 63-3" /NCGR_SAMPLE_ID=MMETSP0052_2 /ASSEMBLY_ACC=CAM_ASM_000194 /LENGTH=195 /DNA_ID=CAMNT_0016346055 /DNA_START=33 /DNA_END=617 /DNA_ORIENTATION=+
MSLLEAAAQVVLLAPFLPFKVWYAQQLMDSGMTKEALSYLDNVDSVIVKRIYQVSNELAGYGTGGSGDSSHRGGNSNRVGGKFGANHGNTSNVGSNNLSAAFSANANNLQNSAGSYSHHQKDPINPNVAIIREAQASVMRIANSSAVQLAASKAMDLKARLTHFVSITQALVPKQESNISKLSKIFDRGINALIW